MYGIYTYTVRRATENVCECVSGSCGTGNVEMCVFYYTNFMLKLRPAGVINSLIKVISMIMDHITHHPQNSTDKSCIGILYTFLTLLKRNDWH